jgi:hypothetical protein
MMERECRKANPILEPSEIQRCVQALREIDFELAYLAVLTCEGIKPLSRWEKPLTNDGFKLLQRIGLLTKRIRRTVRTRREIVETIFSLLPAYLQLYEQCFDGKPIDKSANTKRFEGFLFGYPPCCVNGYIRKPYAENNFEAEGQNILFHWVCKDCKVTPSLLDAYKSVYNLLSNC